MNTAQLRLLMPVIALQPAPFCAKSASSPNGNSRAAKTFGRMSCGAGIFYSAQGYRRRDIGRRDLND
jgi:hypothetical protein